MQRCFQLAALGAGTVSPNPMVGALLCYGDQIIGEGYHQQFGEPHAEVNCINSVSPENKHLVRQSRLYVSLEPCNHFGKTPPCTDLIIRSKIPEVIISCTDPFNKTGGHGMAKMLAAGIIVTQGVFEQEGRWLNRRFFTLIEKDRPYIILKWAQSDNRKIAGENKTPIKISKDLTNRLVHKWRSEEAAILAGSNTVLADNPALTNRLWNGRHPLRLIVEGNHNLPVSSQVLSDPFPTLIFNKSRQEIRGNKEFIQYSDKQNLLEEMMKLLAERKISSLIVEGGAQLLQLFIDHGIWDEARIITNPSLILHSGLAAPELKDHCKIRAENIGADNISYYKIR